MARRQRSGPRGARAITHGPPSAGLQHNPFGINIEVDTSEMQRIIMWLGSLEGVVDKPEMLVPGIRMLGNEYVQNFYMEGSRLGRRWRSITQGTKAKRRERGFPEDPILRQSGKLEWMSAGIFQNWRAFAVRGYMSDDSGQGYVGDGVTSMRAIARSRLFDASITGPKVGHMTGTRTDTKRYGAGFMPARPFWHLNSLLVKRFSDITLDSVMLEWRSKDRRVERISYTRSYTPSGIRLMSPKMGDPFSNRTGRGRRRR